MDVLAQDLQEVNTSVMRMLSLVREQCELAQKALIDLDLEAAHQCIANDEQVDELLSNLEMRILTIIARRQPAAKDLRFLGAMNRAIVDIERAGDYAVHVARIGTELSQKPPLKKYTDIQRILEVLNAMIEMTVNALVEGSTEKAKTAHGMDKEIDDLYEQIQRELLTYMMEKPDTITTATKLLTTARYLERLGDHIENVNEHIFFWVTGERKSHLVNA
jgi:phosphate transport system protein